MAKQNGFGGALFYSIPCIFLRWQSYVARRTALCEGFPSSPSWTDYVCSSVPTTPSQPGLCSSTAQGAHRSLPWEMPETRERGALIDIFKGIFGEICDCLNVPAQLPQLLRASAFSHTLQKAVWHRGVGTAQCYGSPSGCLARLSSTFLSLALLCGFLSVHMI